jgi:predicted pyridoxine 5'-phosphate oxidase superfamily flavin-nucleotide-binding protein
MRETLRVNGAAELTTRPDVIELVSDPGKPAILAVVVRPDEVFMHCAKALIRSSLWEPDTWPPTDKLPSAAQILRDHVGDGRTVAEVQEQLDESIATRLY